MRCYFLGIVPLLTKQYGALEYDFRNWILFFVMGYLHPNFQLSIIMWPISIACLGTSFFLDQTQPISYN